MYIIIHKLTVNNNQFSIQNIIKLFFEIIARKNFHSIFSNKWKDLGRN